MVDCPFNGNICHLGYYKILAKLTCRFMLVPHQALFIRILYDIKTLRVQLYKFITNIIIYY